MRKAFIAIGVGVVALTMGLFDRFKRKQDAAELANVAVTHHEDWATYLARIEGDRVGSIVVDLGLKSIAPIRDKPIRIAIDVQFVSPQESGLPASSEFDRLAKIEDLLQKELANHIGASNIGHIFGDGTGSMYFYAPDDLKAKSIAEQVMLGFPEYSYEVRTNLDPQWEGYDSLYPSPFEMRLIQNHRLIERLIEQGDKLEQERQVDHWIYFRSIRDRQLFVDKVKAKGFKVEDEAQREVDGEKTFQLHISRVDAVTESATDEYISELWKLAEESDGTYDGWETFVIR